MSFNYNSQSGNVFAFASRTHTRRRYHAGAERPAYQSHAPRFNPSRHDDNASFPAFRWRPSEDTRWNPPSWNPIGHENPFEDPNNNNDFDTPAIELPNRDPIRPQGPKNILFLLVVLIKKLKGEQEEPSCDSGQDKKPSIIDQIKKLLEELLADNDGECDNADENDDSWLNEDTGESSSSGSSGSSGSGGRGGGVPGVIYQCKREEPLYNDSGKLVAAPMGFSGPSQIAPRS